MSQPIEQFSNEPPRRIAFNRIRFSDAQRRRIGIDKRLAQGTRLLDSDPHKRARLITQRSRPTLFSFFQKRGADQLSQALRPMLSRVTQPR